MNRYEIAVRGLSLRTEDESDGRTLEGIAVPYGDVIDTWDGAETFDRDCVFDDLDQAKLCYQHGEVIGRIIGGESREDGLHITARVSDTAKGRDAVTLVRDGVLDSFSVGFIPIESERDKAGITHRWRPASCHGRPTRTRGSPARGIRTRSRTPRKQGRKPPWMTTR